MKRVACVLSIAILLGVVSVPGRALAQGESEFNLADQRHLIELGLFAGAWFPPRAHELYDPEGTYMPLNRVSFLGGLRIGYLPLPFIGAELEAALMPTSTRDVDRSAMVYTVRAHVIGQVPWWRITPFLLAGYGFQGISSDFDTAVGSDIDGTFHAGVGVKWYAKKWLVVRLDGRIDVGGETNPGGLKPQFEIHAGASFVLGWKDPPPDKDGDGVLNKDDKCPDVAGEKPTGCPADRDSDGVLDKDDKCPDLAGEKTTGCPADKDGDGVYDQDDKCPEEPGEKPGGCPPDKDGDGVYDNDDKCPDLAGQKPGGCPPDKDKDGVWDTDDKCPEVAGLKPHGCPDADGDGVPEPQDKCPTKKETPNGYQDEDGCPDKMPTKAKKYTGVIKGITFATNSAKLRKRSFPTLDKAVKVLKEYPSLRIKIEGHTDDRADADYNLKLSQERCDAVKAYLVKQGIPAGRLQTEGKGESEPKVIGKSKRARAKNRRIEFLVITGSK